jgi:cation:H+ antiporter
MLASSALFALCAAVIGVAGWTLVAAADAVAERTRLERAFLGMVLVATVTSLPEMSTGLSAVTLAGSPDIAVGAVVGSCVFNLLLFVLADAASGRVAFYGQLRSVHNLTAAFAIVQLGLLSIAVLAPDTARVALGPVGLYSIALAGLYFAGARTLYAVGVSTAPEVEEEPSKPRMSLRGALIRCAVSSVAVVAAGAALAVSADQIAEAARLSDSLVGVLLVAAATSLPELVTVLAAVRLKAYDLAAGNLLGSNAFNLVLIVVYDAAYLDGPLLASTSDTIAETAVVAIVMTAVIVAALNFVRRTRRRVVDYWAGAALVALYLFNAWLVSR